MSRSLGQLLACRARLPTKPIRAVEMIGSAESFSNSSPKISLTLRGHWVNQPRPNEGHIPDQCPVCYIPAPPPRVQGTSPADVDGAMVSQSHADID
jgi:hypothetical protein